MHICVCLRKRERGKMERERGGERERERQTDKQTDKQTNFVLKERKKESLVQ